MSTEFSLQQTCRTCCNTNENEVMIPFFYHDQPDIISPLHLIEQLGFINLKISLDDGLPQRICTDCMNNFINANSFRLICERSQVILEDFFRPHHIDINPILEENKSFYDEPINEVLPTSTTPTKINSYSQFEYLNIEHTDNSSKLTDNLILQTTSTCNETISNSNHTNVVDYNNDYTIIEVNDTSAAAVVVGDDIEIINKLKCEICDKVYKREVHLLRHIKTVHNTNKIEQQIEINEDNKKEEESYAFVCNMCNESFKKSKALQQHENDMHHRNDAAIQKSTQLNEMQSKDRPYMCNICKKSFQSISNRNIHLQSHNEENTFLCNDCGQGFKSKLYLNKHRRSIHTITKHDCPHCNMKFENTVKFTYHLKSHDPNKKFKCKFCDKSFLQQHHLENHERTHTGQRPYLCNHCGKDFKQECNFKLHLRIHSGVRPYICNICGKSFIQRGSFVMHMRQHSGIRPYQCEHCGKDFAQKSSLTVHLRTHTGERPYKCNGCNRGFAQAQQLKYHFHSAHSGPTISSKKDTGTPSSNGRHYPYCCQLCNKGFKLPSSLSSHMKIHTEDRKHICTDCGNSFKRAEHLRIHINGVHLKQKPYACDLCNQTFSQSGDRNIHMRRHTNEKPHQCQYCKKNFRLLKAMRAHIRIHTGERPYECEICKMDFMTYTSLATHTMKHQRDDEKNNQNNKNAADDVDPTKPVIRIIPRDQPASTPVIIVEHQQSSLITVNVPVSEISNIILPKSELF